MDKERMIDIALEEGFAEAAVIPVEELVFRKEFREICRINDCGNYGANYGCPPDCGEPEAMEERVRKYRYAVVFRSETPVGDLMDSQETKAIKKKHTAMTLRVRRRYEQEGGETGGLSIMAGPCNICTPCKRQTGEPCDHEDLRFSCMSAYCIDAAAMAKACGMELVWSGNLASFFSLYCFEEV
ncbi:MAG: DUF2284 domain-containing protein [Blautia sp.]|jgi:predicted metal-binding protein